MPRAPVCPYFGRTKKDIVVCLLDGADAKGTDELRMTFPSQMGRVRYWVGHCCGDWKACSIAAALAEEYERKQKTGN